MLQMLIPGLYIGGYHVITKGVSVLGGGSPDEFSPEAMGNLLNQYTSSMSLEKLKEFTAFEDYIANRKGSEVFSDLKAPDGTKLSDKIASNAGVKKYLDDALTSKEGNTEKMRERLRDEVKFINQVLEKGEHTPGDVRDYLHQLKDDAFTVMKDHQHKHETEQLTKLFGNADKSAELQRALGAENAQFESIKDSMLNALKASQQKELTEFQKSMDDVLKAIHQEAQKESDRVSFFATLYEHNEVMKEEFTKLLMKRVQQENRANHQIFFKDNSVLFKGTSVGDLKKIESITGRAIIPNPDGSFKMDLPYRWVSPFYYAGWNTKMKSDLLSLVSYVKASGYSGVVMTIDHPDKDHANELARQAYAACLEAGFDEKNITIQVGGEVVKASKLFESAPSSLDAAKQYAHMRKEGDARTEKRLSDKSTQAKFREEIQKERVKSAPVQGGIPVEVRRPSEGPS